MERRRYETVRVPVKKTSSGYFSSRRAELEEPVKHCAYCGARLHRKYNPQNGRWEDWGYFLKRKCCDRTCAHQLQLKGAREEREKRMLDGYRPCKEYDGLYVNREGDFIFHGKKKAVTRHTDRYGRKHTALLSFRRDGKNESLSAARLVASAFKRGYDKEDYISYKDGDIHNIHVDNIQLITKKEYYKASCEHAASFRKTATYQYQVDRLKTTIESNEAVLYYFQTGKFDKVNRHVENYLYGCLCDFCLKSLYFGMEQAPMMSADAIARWYEVLLQGHAVGNGERYCKKILTHFKHNGWFGYSGKVPENKIELIINNLNLNCLWEKYKVTKMKK